jgi:hypothetical protein
VGKNAPTVTIMSYVAITAGFEVVVRRVMVIFGEFDLEMGYSNVS